MLGDLFGRNLDAALRAGRNGRQEIVLALDQGRSVVARHFEAVAVGDGVGRAGLDAVTAENAAAVIDVVDTGEPLASRDTGLVGILLGLDVDAVGRAGSRAEEARHALFETVRVA